MRDYCDQVLGAPNSLPDCCGALVNWQNFSGPQVQGLENLNAVELLGPLSKPPIVHMREPMPREVG